MHIYHFSFPRFCTLSIQYFLSFILICRDTENQQYLLLNPLTLLLPGTVSFFLRNHSLLRKKFKETRRNSQSFLNVKPKSSRPSLSSQKWWKHCDKPVVPQLATKESKSVFTQINTFSVVRACIVAKKNYPA